MEKKKSPLQKIIFNSSRSFRISVRLGLLVITLWVASLYFLNRGTTDFQWFIYNVDALRATFGSIFQGLAAFFAIVISVSLLVAQLAYGSFSPRLMPNFLKNRAFLAVVFLFVGTLSFNAILLSIITEQTVLNLVPLILFNLVLSLTAIVSVIPASFILLHSAHPMKIGRDLIEQFNDKYFNQISLDGRRGVPDDDDLPLLQSLIVKSLREADTDYAQRLLGSFCERVEDHISDDNAVVFAGYFDSFFKKVAFIASQENEEGTLQQLVFANEALEKKVGSSKKYLSDSDTRYEASFARNILYIIELSIKNRHNRTLGLAQGAMWRLQEALTPSIPPDNEIATFRTVFHFRNKEGVEKSQNTGEHYRNERIYEYIVGVFFESNVALATETLRLHNAEAIHHFVRDIFRSRYTLEKLNQSTHKEVIKHIAYSEFFNLSRLSRLIAKSNVSIADDIAIGVHEARDFYLKVDPKLAESYIDLLGQLLIETTEREVPSSDPTATFYWAGVALRMFLNSAPPELPIKLLGYFEKVLDIIKKKQNVSSSPILNKMKETICEEIASVRKYEDVDKTVLEKANTILARFPEIKIKEE